MSEAARDQGWLDPSGLKRVRAELAESDGPVAADAGLRFVEETRRLLEEARRARLAEEATDD